MDVRIIEKSDQYLLNQCTKYLTRTNIDSRHNYNERLSPDDIRGAIAEAWRFPIIDTYRGAEGDIDSYAWNEVTFIYPNFEDVAPSSVSIVGTFANLYAPIPLKRVTFNGEETRYFALTTVIPKGEVHQYQYLVDGDYRLDPVNPQEVILENGKPWSQFFTHLCTSALSFETWEQQILERLTEHILPFQTVDGDRFLQQFYNNLDRQSKETQYLHAHRFDQSIGVVNFIDKLLAKEERHHLQDYKICLKEMDTILRARNPFIEPEQMSKEMYIDLYTEMGTDQVVGWNTENYGSPRYFLQLLRRHTFTGAFSHPKYGGNVGAAGWAYLSERYPFNWQQAIEAPLGSSPDYRG